MDLKPRFTLEVYTAGLLVLSTLLTVLVGLLEPRLLWVLIPLLAVLVLVLFFLAGRLRRGLARALQCESFENSQVQLSLGTTALPVALLSGKTLVWYNSAFRQRILADEDRLLAPVGKVLCGLDLHQCSEPAGQVLEHEGRKYNIFASVTSGREALTVLYLVDETDLRQRAAEYDATRPAYMIIEIDAYAEQLAELKDSEKARVLEGINRVLENYIGRTTGFLQRVSNARYIAVVEERHMKEMVAAKFDVLDKIRALEGEVNVTLSIGVGRGGDTLRQCEEMARQSLDMALGRGGDQAAVKTPEGFAFYGGVSRSVEKRSRVKSRIVAKALEAPIRQIAANAGLDGSVILEKVRNSGKNGYGFDAYKEEYCDMVSSGIIDPAKVTRSALENAASVSAMVLTTESLVADKPEPPAPVAPAGGDMGGMY